MYKISTKLIIYDLLQQEPMTFTEINKKVKKAKSTISNHLRDLKEIGLIYSEPNLEDPRSKIFYAKKNLY